MLYIWELRQLRSERVAWFLQHNKTSRNDWGPQAKPQGPGAGLDLPVGLCLHCIQQVPGLGVLLEGKADCVLQQRYHSTYLSLKGKKKSKKYKKPCIYIPSIYFLAYFQRISSYKRFLPTWSFRVVPGLLGALKQEGKTISPKSARKQQGAGPGSS